MLHSNKMEQVSDICNNIDEPQTCNSKWKNSDTPDYDDYIYK